MEGVDIHLDVNVGKQLSALGHTLTMLTGSQEEDEPATVDYDSDEVDPVDGNTPSLVCYHAHACMCVVPLSLNGMELM